MDENRGRVTIAPEVLVTIARLATQSVEGVAQMCHAVGPGNVNRLLGREAGGGGVQIVVSDDTVRVDLYIIIEPDVNMRSVSQKIQEDVTRAIQDMVGMKASAVNIHIQDVAYNRRSS
jgi:uncharacterized alkaline shock family protein YloU